MKIRHLVIMTAAGALFATSPLFAQTLRGSRTSLDRQNQQAQLHEYTYLDGRQDVSRFVGAGLLVPLKGGAHYRLSDVSFQVARPEVRLFVERLSAQYARVCGSPLIVTSLTRPRAGQPSNASRRSVHPTGMALDLRVPTQTACRNWLESTLLALEARNVLDATLERNPRHYHIALFPEEYVAYVSTLVGRASPAVLAGVVRPAATPPEPATARVPTTSLSAHTVRRGETLWRIAQTYDTTLVAIQQANGLSSVSIRAGQRLVIPTSSGD